MAGRLRRLVLINIGLPNGSTTKRISQIDPRGGAAVMGRNGVGKTTALRLIPLFYGLAPSGIVVRGDGQEDLLRFVLPSASSAIAFEYERDDGEDESLRLTVISRSANGDATDYRIFRCGFDLQLFVNETTFRTKLESEDWARAQGIDSTGRLDNIDYRRVILRLPAETKEAQRIARLARDYSLARVPLPNLDRIVAAMTKERASFSDMQSVVVSIIQGDRRASRKVLRGDRQHVDRWLRDRDACEEALRKEPEAHQLREALVESRQLAAQLQALKWRAQQCLAARQRELVGARDALEETQRQASEDATTRAKELDLLEVNVQEAEEAARTASQAVRELDGQAKHYADADAEGWAAKAANKDALTLRVKHLNEQLGQLDAAAKGVRVTFEQQRAELRTRTAERMQAISAQEIEEVARAAALKDEISKQNEATKAAIEEDFGRRKAEARGRRDSAFSEVAGLKAAMTASAPTEEEEAKRAAAVELQNLRYEAARQARANESAAASGFERSRKAFEEGERALRDAKEAHERARRQLEEQDALLKPAEGSLLAALKGSGSEAWRQDIAKTISPALLERTDLSATYLESMHGRSLYGLTVDLEAIETPTWADDAAQAEALQIARSNVTAAQDNVEASQAALEKASATRLSDERGLATARAQAQAAAQAEDAARSAANVLDREIKAAVSARREQLQRAVTRAQKTLAAEEAGEAKVEGERKAALAGASAEGRRQRDEVDTQQQAALKKLEQEKKAVRDTERQGMEGIATAEAAKLAELGVDPVAVHKTTQEIAAANTELQAIEEHAALVKAWKAFALERLHTRPALVAAEESANAVLTSARNAASEYRLASDAAKKHWATLVRQREEDVDKVDRDAKLLDELLETKLRSHLAVEGPWVDGPAEALLTSASQTLAARARSLEGIERTVRDFDDRLMRRDSKIKDALDAEFSTRPLNFGEDRTLMRAQVYVDWYELSRKQTVESLVSELQGIMQSAASFYDEFARFEREVQSFDGRLQKALTQSTVRGRFDRFSDLQIRIECSLSKLGFMAGLRQIADARMDPNLKRPDVLPDKKVAALLQGYSALFGADGAIQVDLEDHVHLGGSVIENDRKREFASEKALEKISSTGITALILLTAMTGFIDMIRGSAPVFVAVATDEIGRFDAPNLRTMLDVLLENRIDVATASPDLTASKLRLFAKNYLMEGDGLVREPRPARALTPMRDDPSLQPAMERGHA
jgi:hypothetical protein